MKKRITMLSMCLLLLIALNPAVPAQASQTDGSETEERAETEAVLPQISHSMLWTYKDFEEYYGQSYDVFRPASPQPYTCLVVLDPAAQSSHDTLYTNSDEDTQEIRSKIMEYVYGDGGWSRIDPSNPIGAVPEEKGMRAYVNANEIPVTFTNNPDLASVVIIVNLQYSLAGHYGPVGTISAYNSQVTLTAYGMEDRQMIAQVELWERYGDTISISVGSSWTQKWPADPNHLENEEEKAAFAAFMDAVAAYESTGNEASSDLTDTTAENPAGNTETGAGETDTGLVREVLEALAQPSYASTYDYLAAGNTITAGERSDYGAGLQTLLNAFDQGLTVDGAVGNQTLAAVHNMQAALGREQTDTVDADLFAELLKCQYTLQKEKEEQEAQQSSESASGVDNIVRENMDPEEYSYLAGCAFVMNGEYYDAWKRFSACMKEEASARAQACVQNWPETGIIYQNESWSSQENHFTIKIDSMPEGKAAVFKIYAENGDLAAILFIGAASSADVWLPGGSYQIKAGIGETWYGSKDAFGEDAYYEVMQFDDGSGQTVEQTALEAGYESTLTINASQSTPEADGVGSREEDYDSF